ncbi:hypothetical protein Gotur_024946 [Gossypium turneri]
MSTSKIETVGMGKSHWSTLRLWRSTSRTEYYGNMAGWSQWPGSSPFLTTSIGPPMYRPLSQEGSQEGPSGSSSFYQTPSPYGFQTPSPLVMQTPPHSQLYQGGSSFQHR